MCICAFLCMSYNTQHDQLMNSKGVDVLQRKGWMAVTKVG